MNATVLNRIYENNKKTQYLTMKIFGKGKFYKVESLDDIPYHPMCSIPKGACVIKVIEEDGDIVKLGSTGETVGGNVAEDGQEAYIIKWDANLVAVSDTGQVADGVLGFILKDRIRQIE